VKTMKRWILIVAVLLLAGAVLLGCSRGDERAAETEAVETDVGESASTETEDETSDAARSRGIVPEDEDEDNLEPKIVVKDVEYEWRDVPEQGLYVKIAFENPAETYERAKGYVFLVARWSGEKGGDVGVYPWNARFEGDYPDDYEEGTRLLFRDEQEVRAFIPYKKWEGYYDSLRLLVYGDDGLPLIERGYELEITGEPTGVVKPKPDMIL
jgi:hypothetical protein